MTWLLVVLAGLFEIGFALSLKASDGFSRPLPTIGFLVCAAVSFTLLTVALRDLPVGTAYAVWTGVGAAGTALVGIVWQGIRPPRCGSARSRSSSWAWSGSTCRARRTSAASGNVRRVQPGQSTPLAASSS